MEQKEFSDYIISGLIRRYPQFENCCKFKSHGIIDIEYKSKQGLVTLRVTTQDREVTIGFSANENQFGFHLHMSQLGASTPDERLNEAINFIDDIIGDKETIIYSNIDGYMLGDIDEIRKYQQPDELIAATVWSKL
jgi:hypothetical protein